MLDLTAAYRTTQVVSTDPAGQVVLLYEGAIRYAMRHLAALERGDREAAHHASLRAQSIVSGLQEVLDLSAGPIAEQLDLLYDFILGRLVDGNITMQARPTEEAIALLRDLLEAWRAIAGPSQVGVAGGAATAVDGGAAPIEFRRPVVASVGSVPASAR
jgi:flagellar protein FliS